MKVSHDCKGDPFKIIPKLISIEVIIDQRIMSVENKRRKLKQYIVIFFIVSINKRSISKRI